MIIDAYRARDADAKTLESIARLAGTSIQIHLCSQLCCVDSFARRVACDYIDDPTCVAIGETGLDYFRDLSPRDAQMASFRAHLQLAVKVRTNHDDDH